MDKIIEKISSYNIFNYLIPGILFAVAADRFLHLSFVQGDLVIGVFVYYFIGLVISRFGSLVIEPLLKKMHLIKFADYKDFVAADVPDAKIAILSEANNMYRTFCSMFSLLLLLKLVFFAESFYAPLRSWNLFIMIVLLLILFIFSYKKQTEYISKRVKPGNS
jgi:hypothetical protein